MNSTKENVVLKELFRMGVDFNTIREYVEVVAEEVEEISRVCSVRLVEYIDNYFNTCGQEYPKSTKEDTCLRFCLTFGIGAAWLHALDNDMTDADLIYQRLAEPRGVFEMDEYIEDLVGIWFSKHSYGHSVLLKHCSRCYDIIRRHYDVSLCNEKLAACCVIMKYGWHMGKTRFAQHSLMHTMKDNVYNPWNCDLWEIIFDADGQEALEQKYIELLDKTTREASDVQRWYATLLTNAEKQEYETRDYLTYSPKDNAGVKTIVQEEDREHKLLTMFPVFNTSRRYYIIMDKVEVMKNGAVAMITAHFIDDEDNVFTFYDTSFLENNDIYYAGECYSFDLYGIGLNIRPVPREEQSFSLKGKDAIEFNKKLGRETEYDDKGNPQPVVFNTKNLHAFLQTDEECPVLADVNSPISAIYETRNHFGVDFEEIEIELSYHNHESEKMHPLSVYLPKTRKYGFDKIPTKGMPVKGTLLLAGRMINRLQLLERPSDILHSFELRDKGGNNILFSKQCSDEAQGTAMSDEEKHEFARYILKEFLKNDLSSSTSENGPHFLASRLRAMWAVPDDTYSAQEKFLNDDHSEKLRYYYRRARKPVVAYITLYDKDGNKTDWINGNSYCVQVHYGSVLPGQKMKHSVKLKYNALVEKLYESFLYRDTRYVSDYLHKDLDFRSCNMADLCITKEEYIYRTDDINETITKDGSHFKPVLTEGHDGRFYIELQYKSTTDILRIEEKDGLIYKIEITPKKV